MMTTEKLHPYDRLMAWYLPALATIAPFIVIYALVRPHVGQGYFFTLGILLALLGQAVAWAQGWRPMPRRVTAPAVLIGLNVLAVACSMFFASRSPMFSLKHIFLPMMGIVFFSLIVIHPARRLVLERISWGLIIVAGVLSLYGVLQHFGIEILSYSAQVQKNTIIATIGHPNYLASVLGPIVFIVLSFIFARGGKRWIFLGGGLNLLILACIMLARTRAVWLGLIIAFVLVFAMGALYVRRHRLGMKPLGGLALGAFSVLLILGGLVAVALPAMNASINLKQRLTSEKEVKSRFFYWHAAIDMGLQKSVFGQGVGMFDTLFWDYTLDHQKREMGKYYYDVLPSISGRTPGHVHNEYLEVFCEQGFAGFGALIALLSFFLYFGAQAVLRQSDPAQALKGLALWGALVTILIDAVFGFPWRLPISLIVFMVVLAWLYDFIYPQEKAEAIEASANQA